MLRTEFRAALLSTRFLVEFPVTHKVLVWSLPSRIPTTQIKWVLAAELEEQTA